jgi:phosphatidate cytidylyltransferase
VLLLVGLAVAMSDVGAFTIGRLLGRRPLAPQLSPSKTIEGVAGNLVGAVAGVLLLSPVWPAYLNLRAALGLGLLIGGAAVWGDLVESALKRAHGAKDAGTWLPGFGGLLDRVDSLILALPLVAYALWAATALGVVRVALF